MSPFKTLRTKTTHAAEDSKEAAKITSTNYHARNKESRKHLRVPPAFWSRRSGRLEVDRHVEAYDPRIQDRGRIQTLGTVPVVLLERCARVRVEQVEHVDREVGARLPEIEDLPETRIGLVDAIREDLPGRQQVH